MKLIKKIFKRKFSVSEILFAAIIFIGAISMLIPFVWMISSSLKTNLEFYDAYQFFPKILQWENYAKFFTSESNFLKYFFNTSKITLLSTIGVVFSCSLTAFAIARIKFPGSKLLFSFALVSMFLPRQVTTIPIFIIFNKLGWYNTHLPMIVPAFLGQAFGIFLLRQFFMSIPKELEEAAKIDGCNWFQIYWKIDMPIVKPALITLAIMEFQVIWGEILRPLIYLSDEKLYTLTMGLRQLTQNQFETDFATSLAGYVLLIAPVMVIFIICQKYFTQSMTSSGLKG